MVRLVKKSLNWFDFYIFSSSISTHFPNSFSKSLHFGSLPYRSTQLLPDNPTRTGTGTGSQKTAQPHHPGTIHIGVLSRILRKQESSALLDEIKGEKCSDSIGSFASWTLASDKVQNYHGKSKKWVGKRQRATYVNQKESCLKIHTVI